MARVNLKVVPGASKTEVCGRYADGLKVRVAAPPEDGRANREVVALLTSALDLPRDSVELVHGHGSSRKVVEVRGLALADIFAKLGV